MLVNVSTHGLFFCFFSFIFLAVSFLSKLKEQPQVDTGHVHYPRPKHSKLDILFAEVFLKLENQL